MIDGIKVNISLADWDTVRDNLDGMCCANWLRKLNNEGQVINENTKYKGIELNWYPSAIKINGSIHKFWNDIGGNGQHNCNDLTHHSLCDALDQLACTFCFELPKAKLENLEVGINIPCNIPATIIIDSHVIGFKNGKQPSNRQNYLGKGLYYEFQESEYASYLFKLYDKASQYNLPTNLLRWEKKYLRSAALKRFGISNLEDLKDGHKLNELLEDLIQEFDKLMIVDSTSPNLSAKVIDKFKDFMNASKWKDRSTCRTMRKRDIEAFNALVRENGLDTLKSTLYRNLRMKVDELLYRNNLDTSNNSRMLRIAH